MLDTGVKKGRAARSRPASGLGVFGGRLRGDRGISVLMIAPTVLVLLAINVYPILYTMYLSLFQYDMSIPNAAPVFTALENYRKLLSDADFLTSARLTLAFVTSAVGIELIVGVVMGLMISGRNPLIRAGRVALLFPFIMAPVAAGVLWRTLFNVNWGPLDWFIRHLGLPPQQFLASPSQALMAVTAVEIWQQLPPVAFVVAAGYSSLPRDVYLAAAVDGASVWQTFWRITLPLLRPVIFVILLLRTMDAFKVYDIIATLTQGGPASQTKLVSYLIWESGVRFLDIGRASAMSCLFLIAVFLISLLFIRALRWARMQTGAT
jgi:multiple sugar transport system permease protein